MSMDLPVDLSDNVIGNTVFLGIPSSRNLTSNDSVKLDCLGHKDPSSLSELDEPLARLLSPDITLVALFSLEAGSVLCWDLERLQIVVELDLLVEGLSLWVITVEEIRLDDSNTGVVDDVFFVLGSDILVVNRLGRLGVNPSDVGLTVLELAVKVLDKSHHPSHFNTAFNRELALGFHLPSSPGATPRADLGKTGTDNDLVQIDQALQVVELGQDIVTFDLGEFELEVGSRSNVDLLLQSLGVGSVGDLDISGIVEGDGSSQLGSLVDVGSDGRHNLVQSSNSVHGTVQVGPNGLNLGDVEQQRVHETKDVEGHFLGREGPDTELLQSFSDKVGGAHETSTSGPSNDGTSDTEVLSPRLGSPSVEKRLERDLGFSIQTVVTESTMVGREREYNLSGSSDELSGGLLDLDGTEQSQQVGQHESVRKLRLVVE
jgi:hypothetical protein